MVVIWCSLTLITFLFLQVIPKTSRDSDESWGCSSFLQAPGPVRSGNHSSTIFTSPESLVAFKAQQIAFINRHHDSSRITRAIIMIHGYERESWNYYDHLNETIQYSADTMDLDVSSVLIVAPQFFSSQDLEDGILSHSVDGQDNELRNNDFCWHGNDWSSGNTLNFCPLNPDQNAGAANVRESTSSFQSIDGILDWILKEGRFPSLQVVVLAGHSLGGQLVHRYSFLGKGAFKAEAVRSDVELHFWIGNAASYLYLSPQRPVDPTILSQCPNYNNYPFGLDGLLESMSPYLAISPTVEELWMAYSRRLVHIAQGTSDHAKGVLGCEAICQGDGHYRRCTNFINYIETFLDDLPRNHTVDYLRGVQHSSLQMLQSPVTMQRLFFDRYSTGLRTDSQAPHGVSDGMTVNFSSLNDRLDTVPESSPTPRFPLSLTQTYPFDPSPTSQSPFLDKGDGDDRESGGNGSFNSNAASESNSGSPSSPAGAESNGLTTKNYCLSSLLNWFDPIVVLSLTLLTVIFSSIFWELRSYQNTWWLT
ncbi:hypothetical protein IE53DRAFT_101461 [Violaceomyces palustris]|uniref:Uncharacterized protein n=1 Tax=Violaceomyces palustris TaxID=1673888 RepID=A0ACD0NWW3_9BASI|nr:hypothetical protein IE53DRAFT_101461 [Violaceomyces palustris]